MALYVTPEYAAVTGPTETRAEYKYIKYIGADCIECQKYLKTLQPATWDCLYLPFLSSLTLEEVITLK